MNDILAAWFCNVTRYLNGNTEDEYNLHRCNFVDERMRCYIDMAHLAFIVEHHS